MTAALATPQAFEALRRDDGSGEWWSARDLQLPLGYDQWRRFEDSIERAMAAASNAGHDLADHFAASGKMVQNGLPVERYIGDYRLSRFGAYLVAMNGDPRKPEIAAAQTYFAVQARNAEVAQSRELTRLEILTIAREAEIGRLQEKAEKEVAQAQVAELQPRAAVADRLIDATGDLSVREAAQVLCRDPAISTGERRLFAFLKQVGWISDARRAMQRHVDIGRVRVRTDTYYDALTGEPHITSQIRITPKGLADLHRMLGGQSLSLVAS